MARDTSTTAAAQDEPQEDGIAAARAEAKGILDAELDGALGAAFDDDADDGVHPDDEALDSELAEGLDEAPADPGDDVDDVDDVDDEDGEDDDEAEEGDEGAEDGGQPRDERGRFAEADKAKPAEGAAAAKDGAKPAAAAEGAKPEAGAEAPQWAPLSVNANKQAHAIEEAKVARVNGNVFLAIPEAQFDRFQQRLSRGIVGEQLMRDLLTKEKELQHELRVVTEGPKVESDAEIEARMYVAALKDKGILESVFEPLELENLDLKIQNAQKDAQKAHDKALGEFKAKLAEPSDDERAQAEEEAQLGGLAQTIKTIATHYAADLPGLTLDGQRAAFTELARVARAVYWKEGEDWVADTQLIFDTLKAKIGTVAAPRSDAATAEGQPGAAPTTATPAAAERHNRGVDSAARPASTSVKDRARRGDTRPSSRATRDARRERVPAKTSHDEQLEAEEAYRNDVKSFMKSPTLDF